MQSDGMKLNMKRRIFSAVAAGSLSVLLAACGEQGEGEKETAIRPVLYVTAQAEHSQQNGFAGTVEPQFSTDFAFRVLGRLIQRDVDVGDFVEKDQVVAMIDPAQLDRSAHLYSISGIYKKCGHGGFGRILPLS